MNIRQHPRSPSHAVTTRHGMEKLRNLFTLCVFGRFSGLVGAPKRYPLPKRRGKFKARNRQR